MSEPKHVVVIDAVPDPEQFEAVVDCFAKIAAVFESYGATNLQRIRTVKQTIGDGAPSATAIIEFPSAAAIEPPWEAMRSMP